MNISKTQRPFQNEIWLPQIQFSKVQSPEHFEGDRWSYMATGSRDAVPVIALHGIGDNSMAWKNQYRSMGRHYRFIGWNAPGYLLSSELKKDAPNGEDYAMAFKDFIDSLGLGKVILLGNSFGSRVAQCFALRFPERVMALIFVGPSAGRSAVTEVEREAALSARESQISGGSYEFPGRRAKALVDSSASDDVFEFMTNAMRATNKRGFLQGVSMLLSLGSDPKTLSSAVRVPILIIAGANDTITPVDMHAKPLKEHLPNSRLILLPTTGHLPHLERPARVNREMVKFLGEVTNRP